MAQILAYPFRFAGSAAATVEADSDEGIAQDLTLLVTTRAGEREMSPGWGISDPTFVGLDIAEVNAALALYGPAGVSVSIASVDIVDPSTERVLLAFDRT